MNKRNFLKASSVMLAGSIIPSRFLSQYPELKMAPEKIYRKLGKTDISVPIVSSGIVPKDNPNLVKAIFESGIRYIDSAWDYGKNDNVVGEFIRKMGREKFVVSTKILLPMDETTGQFTKAATTRAFMEQLETSLTKMGISQVDILYLHKPPTPEALLNEDMMNGLRLARKQGKTRYIGFSNHANQVQLIDAAIASKFFDVATVGYNFRQDQIVKPAIARAHEAGLGIVAMKVFAGEYLDKERNKPVNKTAALKWVLQDENVGTAILSIHTFQELEMYLSVMSDLKLTEQEKADLAEASRVPGLYCLGCGKCMPQCPRNLPVPDLMRAYMYTYGYNEPEKGKKVLNNLQVNGDPCAGCADCKVKCTLSFDVSAKINDIIQFKKDPYKSSYEV